MKQDEPDYTDKFLVRQKFLNPQITNEELGKLIGTNGSNVSRRLNKPKVKELADRMHMDVFLKGSALRDLALKNAQAYMSNPESKEGFEFSKMFAQAVADSPASMPDAPMEAPEFFDPDGDKGK